MKEINKKIFLLFLLIPVILGVSLVLVYVFGADEDCQDTDGGIEIYQKGSCTDSCDGPYHDSCYFSVLRLYEYFCKPETNKCSYEALECPNGECCFDGVCDGAPGECIESDGGKDIFTYGTCQDSCYVGIYHDHCSSAKTISEYSCSDDKHCIGWSEDCPPGTMCENGECIPVIEECVDSDKGKDIYTKGRCEDAGDVYFDRCGSISTWSENIGLEEYYCENGWCEWDAIECPDGECCFGDSGKCNGIAGTCTDTDPDENPLIKGYCGDSCGGGLHYDVCNAAQNGVGQWYCSINNHCILTWSFCSGGTCCEDGECAAEYCNNRPTADAGPDKEVCEGDSATLEGSGSDPDSGDILTFDWSCGDGSVFPENGQVSPTGEAHTTYTASDDVSDDTTYTCTLAITDEEGLSHSDDVEILVRNINQPPDKPTGLDEKWNHCDYKGISLPTFKWSEYFDPDDDPQTGYEIRIDDDSDFSVIEPEEFIASGGASSEYAPSRSDWENWMEWNNNYWWIVRVKDGNNNWSEWSDVKKFKTPKHAHPYPDFSHHPLNPGVDDIVTFIDNSSCYSHPNNIEYPCQDGGATIQYEWAFDYIETEGFTVDSTQKGDVTWIYSSRGEYEVKLKITDNSLLPFFSPGFCIGKGDSPVGACLPLPEWKEIPPTSWLKNFLAETSKIFNF